MEAKFVEGAPEAIGPYCHAMRVGNLVFCSGQTPIDPETGEIAGSDVGAQTERVLANLLIVLGGLGLTLAHVAKTNVFLHDMTDFKAMNAAYEAAFGGHKPARTTVAVKGLPLGALVEIECVAAIPVEDAPASVAPPVTEVAG